MRAKGFSAAIAALVLLLGSSEAFAKGGPPLHVIQGGMNRNTNVIEWDGYGSLKDGVYTQDGCNGSSDWNVSQSCNASGCQYQVYSWGDEWTPGGWSAWTPGCYYGYAYRKGQAYVTRVNPGYCPSGYVINAPNRNRSGLPWSGTATCYKEDSTPPTITFSSPDGYVKDNWSNAASVTVNVTVTDNSAEGLDSVWYQVGNGGKNPVVYKIQNGTSANQTSTFSFTFTEEGSYPIRVYAIDNAEYDDWGNNLGHGGGNFAQALFTVNIDRAAPIFQANVANGGTEYDWRATKPTLNFKIDDTYKGEATVSRNFACPAKPANSHWTNFTQEDGTVAGECTLEAGGTGCETELDFYPNSAQCSWQCDTGPTQKESYVKGRDGLCHAIEVPVSCDNGLLDSRTYTYGTGSQSDVLIDIESSEKGTSNAKIVWKYPSENAGEAYVGEGKYPGVDPALGIFSSFYDVNLGEYVPKTEYVPGSENSCDFECRQGYHTESTEGSKCINDTRIYCCSKTGLSTAKVVVGKNIDCNTCTNVAGVGIVCDEVDNSVTPSVTTKVANPAACVPNEKCGGGFVKDLLGEWDKVDKVWKYRDNNANYGTNRAEGCAVDIVAGSDGVYCLPGRYLTGNLASPVCAPVTEVGKYGYHGTISNGTMVSGLHDCTNKPSEATYTGPGTGNNDCPFTCPAGKFRAGNSCTNQYQWQTGNYGSCSPNATCNDPNGDPLPDLQPNGNNSGIQYRTVFCKNTQNNAVVDDSNCELYDGPKPTVSQQCTPWPQYAYRWRQWDSEWTGSDRLSVCTNAGKKTCKSRCVTTCDLGNSVNSFLCSGQSPKYCADSCAKGDLYY